MSVRNTDLDVGLTTVALRAILASQGGTGGRADVMAHRLGEAIRLGLILDGERLPSESRLAEQLGVAVVTLREALATLRQQGLIRTSRGRGGGTVVTAPADREQTLAGRLSDLTAQDLRDLGDLRSAVFGTAAALAARRAMPADVARLAQQVERLDQAVGAGELRRADTQFTIEVATAAQSPRLVREELRVRTEVGDLLWLDPDVAHRRATVRLRRRLVRAIERRDAAAARRLAESVVATDTARLVRQRLTLHRQVPTTVARDSAAVSDLDGELLAVFDALDGLAGQLGGLVAEHGDARLRRSDLAVLRPRIGALLTEHRGTIVGAGVITRPDLLQDAPRWLEWWWTRQGAAPELLRVNLDPAAPDFYDYTGADWFELPRASGRRQIAGPFVDHACTGEYSITLTVPVLRDEEFLGVAAADILVSSIERRVLPRLVDLEQQLVLATGEGRVVVSTDPDWLPGMVLPTVDVDLSSRRLTAARSPLSSWALVTTDDLVTSRRTHP